MKRFLTDISTWMDRIYRINIREAFLLVLPDDDV